MPGRDGTGSMCAGTMTGRGLGFCAGVSAARYGAGHGCGRRLDQGIACRRSYGRGLCRSFAIDEVNPEMQKRLLENKKAILEKRLDDVNKQLEDF